MGDEASAAEAVETETVDAGAEGHEPAEVTDTPAAANDNGAGDDLSDEEIAALASAKDPKPADDAEPTVKLGDAEVPLSALREYLASDDDLLRQVKRKIKAAGEEREISLAEALEAVPKAEGWQKKMYDADQRVKALESVAERMQGDPIGALMALGKSEDEAIEIVAKQLKQRFEIESMTPEQRQEYERRRELEEKAKRADEYEAQERQRREEAEVSKLRESFLGSIKEALGANGVPLTKYAVGRVGYMLEAATANGVINGNPTAADFKWAADQVKREIDEERASYLPDDADGDALIAAVGESQARKIARAYAKRIKASQPVPERQASGTRRPSNDNGRAKSWDEFFAERDKAMGIR